MFNEFGLTIQQADVTGDVIKILGQDGKEITRISTQYKGSGQKFINFLKGYLKNVDGGILQELLSQGVIPKIAKGKTKPKADEPDDGKPDTTLNQTEEDCPGTWDDIMKTCG